MNEHAASSDDSHRQRHTAYTVGGKPQETTVTEMTATEILERADFDPATFYLVRIEGERRESYHDHPHKAIQIHQGMVFEAAHCTIHFEVDGETISVRNDRLTPKVIMEKADVTPATHYLKRLTPCEESFRDRPEVEIEVHQGDRFITLYTGQTPVS